MRETIDRILEGNFAYESGKIEFAEDKIELVLKKESDYEGSFRIHCDTDRECEGRIVSSDLRMECLTKEFIGNDGEISFRFHGQHTEEGDVIKGYFGVISNLGEYCLPYVISVIRSVPVSSEGEIKNLFLFANLAKGNWTEAVKLFYSPDFVNVISGNDPECVESYRALSANSGNEQNVEEFLIYINKKQKNTYSVNFPILDISARSARESGNVLEREIEIVRKGWGYTAVNVECEGDFLFTGKEFLDDNDFLGSRCRLPVFVDLSACHGGINSGKIFLFNSYFSVEVPVNVHVGSTSGVRKISESRKKMISELMRAYIDYRLKKIKKNVWLKEAGKYAERMVAMDTRDVEARLFQIHVLITEGRRAEAGWYVDHAADLMAEGNNYDAGLKAYFHYLSALVDPDTKHIKKAENEIRELCARDKKNWRPAWLLYYLKEEYANDPVAAYRFMEKMFEWRCESPIVYAEAFLLICENPSLLQQLGRFEIQVLFFGQKNGVTDAVVTERVLELCPRVKEFSPVLYTFLCSLYEAELEKEKKEDVRILKEICSLLIKGEKHGPECRRWYRLGAEKQLRITNIYEYYLMSLNPDEAQEIPEPALIYFSYQSQLDQDRRSYLYRYVYERRERIPALYEKYEPEIRAFTADCLSRGQINRHLAVLYQEILTEDQISETAAHYLSEFLFTEWITVSDKRLKKLYIYKAEFKKPMEYDLVNGACFAAVYGKECLFVFEDAYGNRFLGETEYTREKLMISGRFMKTLESRNVNNGSFDFICHAKIESEGIGNDESAKKIRNVAESGILTPQYEMKMLTGLMEYYYGHDDLRELAYCVRIAKEANPNAEARDLLLKYLFPLGNYDLAYEWIREYGPYFVDTKTLLKFLDALIPRRDLEDEALLYAAVYAFESGRYDSCILRYLVHYYRGLSRQMRDVWKVAGEFEVDTYELAERILIQMMDSGAFVGDKLDIFKSYIASGAKEKVAKAFIMHCSYEYFVRERMTEDIVFDEMRRMHERKEEIPRVCKLAYLKYYAENKEDRTEKKLGTAGQFLREMIAERIFLNFFREYTMFPDILKWMEDRSIVEYRTVPGGKARIHFCHVRENKEACDYFAEYMRDVYGGVCFKDFVLFFGEKIQYYIMEEVDGEEKLTESGTVQMSDHVSGTADSRFAMINDMAISNAMGDYDTLDGLFEDFFRKEFFNGELFKLE